MQTISDTIHRYLSTCPELNRHDDSPPYQVVDVVRVQRHSSRHDVSGQASMYTCDESNDRRVDVVIEHKKKG